MRKHTLTSRPARDPEWCTLGGGKRLHILGGNKPGTFTCTLTFCGLPANDSDEANEGDAPPCVRCVRIYKRTKAEGML